MTQPPFNKVTFMFTDIEGSTKLWEQYPAAMKENIVRHDALVDGLIETYGGTVIDHAGDGVFAVFEGGNPVGCVIEFQRSLKQIHWEAIPGLKVRVALHSGIPHKRGEDYRGPLVNRTARIMGVGWGSQVLVTPDVPEVCAVPQEANLKDLGYHRLKDLSQPQHILQLLHPDLEQDFPALRSLSFLANNLPAQTTSFIGRERDMAQLSRLLDKSRLVTLTGFGGTGKTRLSLQVAADLIEHYADGVWFVELAPISEPSLVPSAIAEVLEVSETPDHSMLESLKDALQNKHLLLVLDNCEHVLEACAEVGARLLQGCPQLRILATSREELNIRGETTWAVSPLPLPKADLDLAGLLNTPSLTLFVERAQAAKPTFQLTEDNAEAVAYICHRLDGIPLALELAAARVKIMPPQKLVERLEDRFRYLTGGARTELAHHQTLRATIDWSYDLLDEAEKVLLNRLSVFRGGFVMEAAEGVCAEGGLDELEVLDYLSQLVRKSLVVVDDQGDEARYHLLETVRQYGQEKLDEVGETDRLGEAHLAYFLGLAETAEPELEGPDQAKWLQRLDEDHDNLRVALRWALQQGKAEEVQQMCVKLGRFWRTRGYYSEGRAWIKQAWQQPQSVSKETQAKSLRWAGELARVQGDYEEARTFYEQALSIDRELDNKQEICINLNSLGILAHTQGDFEGARTFFEQALSINRELGYKEGISRNLNNLGVFAILQGDYEEAKSFYEQALSINRELGHEEEISINLNNLGEVAYAQGDYEGARTFYEQALSINRELGYKDEICKNLNNLGVLAHAQALPHLAAQLQGMCARLLEETGIVLEPHERTLYDNTQDALKQVMGEDDYKQAFEMGHRLTLEQAMALALEPPKG